MPFVYINNELAWINTPEGRVVNQHFGIKEPQGDALAAEFHLRDHLGNTRMVLLAEGVQYSVEDFTDYYPFGMQMREQWEMPSQGDLLTNRYLYNGKEMQNDMGLGWYDYGARFYDGQIGRWHGVDPLAEKYFDISPYAYVSNNPMYYIDPDGRQQSTPFFLLRPISITHQSKSVRYVHRNRENGMSKTNAFIMGETEAFGEFVGPLLAFGGIAASGPALTTGAKEMALLLYTLKSPEMMVYLYVKYPKLVGLTLAALEVYAPASNTSVSTTQNQALVKLIELLFSLEGDTRTPQNSSNSTNSNNTNSNSSEGENNTDDTNTDDTNTDDTSTNNTNSDDNNGSDSDYHRRTGRY